MLLGQADAQFRLFTGKDLPQREFQLGIEDQLGIEEE
jgi:hypothetical protein